MSNINKTICKNSISVNRNGSVGYAFYHKYDALYSNDCRKLTVKKCNNEYVSLFITNQIMQQKEITPSLQMPYKEKTAAALPFFPHSLF